MRSEGERYVKAHAMVWLVLDLGRHCQHNSNVNNYYGWESYIPVLLTKLSNPNNSYNSEHCMVI
jgi:hypothetical protein